MYLKTERLVLREFTMDDLADLHEILSDPLVMEYCEPPYDLAKSEKFLREFCVELDPKRAFAVELKSTGKVIGYVLWGAPDYPEIVEAGWFFNQNYWRQGYAFEALTAMLRYGFEEQNLHKVFAETTDGVRSVGVMHKLGMRDEGVHRQASKSGDGWQDLYWFGILAEDYLADKAAASSSVSATAQNPRPISL
jgi:RimJ/RimL family protein N-acetyltransferase